MLDATLKSQLAGHLARLVRPVELIASLDAGDASWRLQQLLAEIASLSPQITLRVDGEHPRRPSFTVGSTGGDDRVRFAAVPLGHEFTSLVLALLHAGGVAPKVDAATVEQIRGLDADLEFETWMSLSCHNCPDVVQALNLIALLNPRVRHVAIDGALFAAEGQSRQIMAVPSVFLNGEPFGAGRMTLAEILARVDTGAAARAAARLASQPPLDVLVIGGGPAGAAAAVYAARKGIATALVAERFGGQTLDTLAIENYVSVDETTGPRFAAALEAQVRRWGVELVNGQRVESVQPASAPGGLARVTLAGGARLEARSVVLAPGARWRTLGVPGEAQYRNKGVAFCPHCDGPLFKGLPVAVVGGGNSGVEAAIDLAGIASQVTLVEYADRLKADAVLVRRLQALGNVRIVTSAEVTEIGGDGQRVTSLAWRERGSGALQRIALAGVFVQIGLVPNTEFLRGAVELTRHGEIVIDARGATSAPGIFAAGDATTAPYKQIVVAAGDGAKAALSAFDHLIRSAAPAAPAVAPSVADPLAA